VAADASRWVNGVNLPVGRSRRHAGQPARGQTHVATGREPVLRAERHRQRPRASGHRQDPLGVGLAVQESAAAGGTGVGHAAPGRRFATGCLRANEVAQEQAARRGQLLLEPGLHRRWPCELRRGRQRPTHRTAHADTRGRRTWRQQGRQHPRLGRWPEQGPGRLQERRPPGRPLPR
jgi:hypothetical protein